MEPWERQFDILADMLTERGVDVGRVINALKNQVIELPSWAVGNSGTRYGVFRQPGAARHIWDKIDDCAEIQRVVGVCPVMASHVLWDVTEDGRYEPVREYAAARGLRIGTVHPNTFMGQQFRLGSVCSPEAATRASTIEHFIDCVRITREMGSKVIGIWLADGTNYPGQDHLRTRKHRLFEGLKALYDAMDPDMTLVVEYKFFEPSFYTTDLMDWGMSFLMCQRLGERAKVLVDLGHHPKNANIEHIVAILLDEGKLGGFHLNDCKYADDDLMAGTINPLQLFLIFDQIVDATLDPATAATAAQVVYMLDQSHNIEGSIEGIIQSVMNTQTAYAKALIVDRPRLRAAQEAGDVILANRILMEAFETDVQPLLKRVRVEMGRHPDPLVAYREGGYARKIAAERGNQGLGALGG
ncbi:MAG: TIM barrel protein [Anaerolineae bacterium]|nr:TIM barrel protein [Caldilineales bacterium]MDW8268283.1 TIM barrel protein [Anaerolineae bacterium]